MDGWPWSGPPLSAGDRGREKAMNVSDLLVTGFPGFLASALLPRLLARRDGARAVCVVQAQHLPTARDRVDELVSSDPELAGRVDLVVGDITEPWLGLEHGGPHAASSGWARCGTWPPSTT